jgi:hypothetical protein
VYTSKEYASDASYMKDNQSMSAAIKLFLSKKELRYESDSCYDELLLIQSHTQGSHLCNQDDARQNRTGMQLGGKYYAVTDRHK